MSTTRREAILTMIAAALGAAVARGEDPNVGRWVRIQDGGRAWLGPVRPDGTRELIVEVIHREGIFAGQRMRAVFPRMYPAKDKPGSWEWRYEHEQRHRGIYEDVTFGDALG